MHKAPGEGNHKCDVVGCGRSFGWASHLRRHAATHKPAAEAEEAAARQKAQAEGTFTCLFEGCGASCGSYNLLQRHKALVHPGAQVEKAAARQKAAQAEKAKKAAKKAGESTIAGGG